MKRRKFIQTSTAASVSATLPVPLQAAAGRPDQPNLLIIHCDELNFRTLGCYRETLPDELAFMWGKKMIAETPHIDSLAHEGALCTKMYAATPVCSPSRSSFLTGQYPQNTPVVNNNIPLNSGMVTFGSILKENGYVTGYAGKWHLDGSGKPQWAPERNFGFTDNRYMFNRGHWKQFEDTPDGPRIKARDAKGKPSYSVKGADEKSFATDWLTGKTIDFIDEHQNGPWAYMVSIPDPHGPDTVRPPYDTMYDDRHAEKPHTFDKPNANAPSWAKPQPKCHYKMASYLGMIKCIDDNVGRMLEALKKRKLFDKTIVVFTADHGDMRGEHGMQNKGYPMEGSAKIPFLMRAPGIVPKGLRVNQVYNTVDFLPTVLDLMGVKTAGREEGRNCAELFRSRVVKEDWKDVGFMRSTSRGDATKGWLSAVTPRYKLVLSSADKTWLLDLEKDPDEVENFIDRESHRDIARQLAHELAAYARRFKDPYVKHPNTKAALQALLEA